MLLLIDLDGTLIYTINPEWKSLKDGACSIESYLDNLPFFPGAKEFIKKRQDMGDSIVVVSDSHFKYVEPICKRLNVEYLALADKPNDIKTLNYLRNTNYYPMLKQGKAMFIGDTELDIELARRLEIPSIWLYQYVVSDSEKEKLDIRDCIGKERSVKKLGPTYEAKSFDEVEQILQDPVSSLYMLEAIFQGKESGNVINNTTATYQDRSEAKIVCLGRQQEGLCDSFAIAHQYQLLSSPDRTPEFLDKLSGCVSAYLAQQVKAGQEWHYFTYLSDKATTQPANKMKEIFDRVETDIPKIQLLRWKEGVTHSLRNENLYGDRKRYLEKFLELGCPELNLRGKNVIVLDDQITTSATAWHVIRCLRERGAYNVLFVGLFQMVLRVNTNFACPRCGKPMSVKLRRKDGGKFLSCTPPEYRGNGCGYAMNLPLFL